MQADLSDTNNQPPEGNAGQSGARGMLSGTLSSIGDNLRSILRGEVALAKAELKEEATQAGKAGGMIAGGGVLGLTGFMFLTWGVTYLLARKMPMWLSASLVGSALVGIAGFLGMSGKNQLQQADLTPEKTIDSLKQDKDAAMNAATSMKDDLTPGSA